MDYLERLKDPGHDLDRPTLLYEEDGHAVYWLGIPEESAFRCNSYLVVDHRQAILIDPGSRPFFDFVKKRVEQIIPLDHLAGMVLCHQDPDVSASMVDWLELLPDLLIISSQRANILLPYYGKTGYRFMNVADTHSYRFASGYALRFIESPFLHFPGAFVTWDSKPGFLFSGDVWAALDIDWKLVISDFEYHKLKLNLFHIDYMPCNKATAGFAGKIRNLEINGILPQHGSVIPKRFVPEAIEYLETLKCGLDFLYPET